MVDYYLFLLCLLIICPVSVVHLTYMIKSLNILELSLLLDEFIPLMDDLFLNTLAKLWIK